MNHLTQKEINSQAELKIKKPLVWEKVIKFDEKFKNNIPFPTIQLHYRYSCNMNCQHCSISDFRFHPSNKNRSKLSIEDMKSLSKQADEFGISQFDVSGGEPTTFKEFDELIAAIDPMKFYIQLDTNAYLLTEEKLQHMKDIGIDVISIGLDSLDEKSHDDFRRTPGAWKKCIEAIDLILKVGLKSKITTFVDKKRLYSDEFIQFLEFTKSKNTTVGVCFPYMTGEYCKTHINNYELITQADFDYLEKLSEKYKVYSHLSKQFGRPQGCMAVKRMIAITAYGDVMPCPWTFFSLGNIKEISLKEILDKGMKYFGHKIPDCRIVMNKEFITKYVSQTLGIPTPIPIEQANPPFEESIIEK